MNGDNAHVVILHRYFWPENVAVLPLMFKTIAEYHLSQSHSVTVVCGSSADFSATRKSAFGGRVKFVSFDALIDRQVSKFSRILNSMKLFISAAKELWQVRNKSNVMLYTVSYPPLFSGLIILWIKLIRTNVRTVYYLQDNHTYLISNKIILTVFNFYQRQVVRNVTSIFTLSESMKEGLLEIFSAQEKTKYENKVVVLPNFSTDLIEFSNTEILKDMDIIYAGNHGVAQNLDYFINAIKLAELNKHIKIKFFGDGTEKNRLVELCEKESVLIDFLEPVGREEISTEISKARYGLVAAKPGLTRYAHPSKLAAYCSSGAKSIVMCEPDSALSRWLADNDLGVTIDPVNIDNAARQLREIFLSTENCYETNSVITKSHSLFSESAYLGKLDSAVKNIL